jgi:hypothetical protein
VKTALVGSGAVEIDLEQGAGFVLPDDTGPEPAVGTWSALLPSLDPTVMGWKGRDWYLGSHREQLFDRNGNAGPTVWVNGKVVGGWSQAEDGEIRFELLEPVDSDAEARIAAQAAELEIWLGEVRIKPRFPTPLDRRLRS